MSENIVTGTNDNFNDVINGDKPVLVDFWAEWCGPCKMLSPLLDAVADERSDSISVMKVNIDQVPELAPRFGVRGIPTLLLFKEGKVIGTKVGALSKTLLDEFLDDNL